ncbi:DUF4280 domain-containing protein [uncultured Maribacter sp.]|uniref:DUF4280 domain-containing protein n=1 Tax=uncultured Maribacter sp. TaxID=431308 RepID=UPI00262BEFBF|nr:DUF4280 domain-containing protein [uncultured Maribacter sp.]
MSQKHLVCQGALCQCQFGAAPDTLKVLTQSKIYINDDKSSEKLVATTMELGPTFEKNTFGTCTMTNSSCVPNIILWDGFYDKVTLPNKGNPLLEDSKGTCAIGGIPSVEFLTHGQMSQPSEANVENTDEEILLLINPVGTTVEREILLIPID